MSKKKTTPKNYIPRSADVWNGRPLAVYNKSSFVKCNVYSVTGTWSSGMIFVLSNDKQANRIYVNNGDYPFEGTTLITKSFFKKFSVNNVLDLSYEE